MGKTKHTARKNVAGSSSRTPMNTGSESDEPHRPFKRIARRSPSPSPSDDADPDFEEELAAEELPQPVARRSKLGSRRASYMPQPPPAQPEGEARRISSEPPATLGRNITNFTTLGAASYLTFRRDVNQYEVDSDSTDSRFRTNV